MRGIRYIGYPDSRAPRRPRWLGRWSAYLIRSISWVRALPSAYELTRKDFILASKTISGKRESVS